jgi:hypothetical protein
MNNSFVKGMMFALLIIYVVAPADFLPGPVDDILAILFYFTATKAKREIKRNANIIETVDSGERPN